MKLKTKFVSLMLCVLLVTMIPIASGLEIDKEQFQKIKETTNTGESTGLELIRIRGGILGIWTAFMNLGDEDINLTFGIEITGEDLNNDTKFWTLELMYSTLKTGRIKVIRTDIPFSGFLRLDIYMGAVANGSDLIQVQAEGVAIGPFVIVFQNF